MIHVDTPDGKFSLVSFHDEDSIAAVPSKKVMCMNDVLPKEGDVVNVLWDDKRQYAASFLMTGKESLKHYM